MDVVVRPEDVLITTPDKGQITGVVDSSVFKGMYYEITALLEGDNEIVIQSTRSARVGDCIGMCIEPDGIHVMPAGVLVNVFDGEITKDGRVAFAGGNYECDLTQLYEGSRAGEDASVITAEGEEISLAGMPVTVEIPGQGGIHERRGAGIPRDRKYHLLYLQGKSLQLHGPHGFGGRLCAG